MKLQWIVKQWLPGVSTYSWHGDKRTQGVYVQLSNGGPMVLSPFVSSHAAAAAWACEQVGKSLDLLGRS